MENPIAERSSNSAEPIGARPLPARQGTFSAMRHRNFQLYFGGQLVSNIGTWMQVIAQAWVVYQIGHSELILGLVAFASAIPVLVISPWAGVVVDRMPRRTLLMMTQTGAMILAFVMAALTFTNLIQEWQVIVLAALLGVVNAFDAPARQAFVPEIVSREDLPNAIAMNSMMFNSARVIGPAIAGLTLAAFGAAWCFTINGISFLAVLIGLWLITLPDRRIVHTASAWNQLVGGLRYTSKHREISTLILISLVFSVFGISYSTILPAFVENTLHQGAAAYGWINTATGLGAVMGAFLLMYGISHGRRGKLLVVVNIAFPILLMLFAFTTQFVPALILAFGLGLGFMTQFTTLNTLLQTRVDDDYRGRVMGLYTLTFFGFAPFGNLIIGYLGEKMGLSLAMALFAACSLILSTLILSKTPQIRKLE
jgi:MFS family permease